MDRASVAHRRKASVAVLLVLAFGWSRAEAQSARPIEARWAPNGTVSAIAGGTLDTIGPHAGASVRLDASTASLALASPTDGVVCAVARTAPAGSWEDVTRVLGSTEAAGREILGARRAREVATAAGRRRDV